MNLNAKKIKVTIDALGNPKVEAEGFLGQGCTQATAPIENALSGGGGVTRVLKPEAIATDLSQEQHVRQW